MSDRTQWNDGALQGQKGIPTFADRSKFCGELGLELHFRLMNYCSVFQAEIFAVLKAIETIADGFALDLESYMIFISNQVALGDITSV